MPGSGAELAARLVAMKPLLRPTTPADAPAILAVLSQAGLRHEPDLLHQYWKYWQPRSDWSAPRSFVLEKGGEPISHGAIIPGSLWDGIHRTGIIHVIDWAARPGETGAGVTLIEQVSQQLGPLVVIGGSAETLRI